ncbi:MAG TPA: hypothetical protein PKI93_04695 [Alphaproteobacteria bacterium]|nr:hypothetical protein [Alphaproteobacteria bacterium]HNS43998.1 hypothetical protein [Alphaproteobacteria bacterium]
MGTLTSVLTPILSIGSALSGAQRVSQDNRENDLRLRQYEQNAALHKKQNLFDLQNAETERRTKLKKLISAQRAQFGSGGIRSGAGSSEAVLEGLFSDSDIERQQGEGDVALANQKINQGITQQRQLNLLQKEQLRQKTILNTLLS